MWMIIKTNITLPLDDMGKPISCENWDASIIKKVEANAKATCTLQCGLTREGLNRVGLFTSAKELWKKLIELHEGTTDTLHEGISDTKECETTSQLHARIQDLLNGLHGIKQKIENKDTNIRLAEKGIALVTGTSKTREPKVKRRTEPESED
ncbi:uncharacterized protein LOC121995427 [Zingiber officinale]|uniref:uncharacterized protein LOC121995427 n=1 Tax=Zingiber officinale TaxID=94328 RepID=UPI001C4AFD1F|nr:uncharacterized protein LOC121995427 [Zingiber officinale]